MTQTLAYDSQQASRLVRYLADTVLVDANVSHKNFADKLGRLIDLSDSFTLSESLRGLSRLDFDPGQTAADDIKRRFLEERSAMVEAIVKAFVPDSASMQLSLGSVARLTDSSSDKLAYIRMYSIHQSDLESKVQRLRMQVREALSGQSQRLAQLSALDAALGDTLSVHGRKMYTVIPKLLSQRYDALQIEFSSRDDGSEQQQLALVTESSIDNSDAVVHQAEQDVDRIWLDMFIQEMQGLLLAELEVRLQPVVGLIEALDEEVTTKL